MKKTSLNALSYPYENESIQNLSNDGQALKDEGLFGIGYWLTRKIIYIYFTKIKFVIVKVNQSLIMADFGDT